MSGMSGIFWDFLGSNLSLLWKSLKIFENLWNSFDLIILWGSRWRCDTGRLPPREQQSLEQKGKKRWSPHVTKQKSEHERRARLTMSIDAGSPSTWNALFLGILGVQCTPVFQSVLCAYAPGQAALLGGVRAWQGAPGASWESRGKKRVGFPQFSVDEFFVVSSFSHGKEMLLGSTSIQKWL